MLLLIFILSGFITKNEFFFWILFFILIILMIILRKYKPLPLKKISDIKRDNNVSKIIPFIFLLLILGLLIFMYKDNLNRGIFMLILLTIIVLFSVLKFKKINNKFFCGISMILLLILGLILSIFMYTFKDITSIMLGFLGLILILITFLTYLNSLKNKI